MGAQNILRQIRRGLRDYGFFGVLAILPPILWIATVEMPSDDMLALWLRATAKAAAFGAVGCFLVSVMLITRLPIVEGLCNGLDRAYVLHRWLAKLSLGLMGLHVVFLVLYSMASSNLSTGDVLNPTNAAVAFGILSCITLLALIITALKKKTRHQLWIWLHRIFSTSMIWAWIHVLISQGDAKAVPLLWWSIFVMGLFAIAAWFYRVSAPLLVKKYRYEVAEVDAVDDHVTEITLKPLGKELEYRSGQYAWINFDDPAVDGEPHPFSFATADNGKYIRFTVKKLGDFTSSVANIKPGAKAWIEGPFGRLDMRAGDEPHQVWIAGGIGLAPFLSMARDFDSTVKAQVTLMYAFHDLHDAAFLLELRDIEALTRGRFKVMPINEETQGYINLDYIKQCTPDVTQTKFMLCGPPVMMNSVIKQLLSAGVRRDNIHAEEFAL